MTLLDCISSYLQVPCKPAADILNVGTLGESSYCMDSVLQLV